MAFEFLKRLYRKFLKKKIPKTRSQDDLKSEFLNTCFEDGTLVEYQEGYGYNVEFDRGRVREVKIKGREISINTDGRARFGVRNYGNIREIDKIGEVFYFGCSVPGMDWKYAIARPGVEIPKRPSLEEISNERE